MSLRDIVALWKSASLSGTPSCLATVVHVEGSSYRKPGARMLVTATGQRAGTISGGCLEGDVARKISWLTSKGPVVHAYRSEIDDDGTVLEGSGCGATVWLLLQGPSEAEPTLRAMESAVAIGASSEIVCTLYGVEAGRTVISPTTASVKQNASNSPRKTSGKGSALPREVSLAIAPPPQLFVFGAGADAVPVVKFAGDLGWTVLVADGRSHLLREERFATGTALYPLSYSACEKDGSYSVADGLQPFPNLPASAAAVIMTHSFQQDCAVLKRLLFQPLAYLGILGPVHRTRRLLHAIEAGLPKDGTDWLTRLHAPVGLPIGGDDPTTIALSIVAEVQATFSQRRLELQTSPVL